MGPGGHVATPGLATNPAITSYICLLELRAQVFCGSPLLTLLLLLLLIAHAHTTKYRLDIYIRIDIFFAPTVPTTPLNNDSIGSLSVGILSYTYTLHYIYIYILHI